MKENRCGILWGSFIQVPAKCFYYGGLGGGFSALVMILIERGWNPAAWKYVLFLGFAMMKLGWGIIGGIQHYLMLRKIYGEK